MDLTKARRASCLILKALSRTSVSSVSQKKEGITYMVRKGFTVPSRLGCRRRDLGRRTRTPMSPEPAAGCTWGSGSAACPTWPARDLYLWTYGSLTKDTLLQLLKSTIHYTAYPLNCSATKIVELQNIGCIIDVY